MINCYCPNCKIDFKVQYDSKDIFDYPEYVRCPTCEIEAKVVGKDFVTIHGCDSFNPHYDTQMDKWFESADHKKSWMKKKGYTQVSGQLSPRESSNYMKICSREQGQKLESHDD